MRVYFLSTIKAGIKLNGLFLGFADKFERYVELTLNDGVFAEFLPEGDFLSTNFFIDERLLSNPPEFLDVYIYDDDLLIYVKHYAPKTVEFKILAQTRFLGNLISVFMQGKIYLSFDGKEYFLHELPLDFKTCSFEEKKLEGLPVLAVRGGEYLAIISQDGKLIFLNKVLSFSFDNGLAVSVDLQTCLNSYAECIFSFDGRDLSLVKSKTVERVCPEEKIIAFAFFQSVLTSGNFKRFLCDDLLDKAPYLKEFLGDFCDVLVPFDKFFIQHGDIKAVGLVYPKSKNLYTVKHFAVETENGKITNVFPVE